MAWTQPTLSVCCLTHGPLERTAEVLDQVAPVADEIVCAVDASVPLEALSALDGHADAVVRCPVDRVVGMERNLAWLHGLCTGRWILRIDSDEVLSEALVDLLPELLAADDVLQYLIRRRWLYPDPVHVLDDYPWSDDWQLRLVRNEPGLLHFDGEQHTSADLTPPYRTVDEALLHLDLVLTTPDSRREKVRRYEAARPEYRSERGTLVNDLYLPEDVDAPTLGTLSTTDAARVRAVVDARGRTDPVPGDRRWRWGPGPTGVRSFDRDAVDRYWAGRPVPSSAHRARFEVRDPVGDLQVGERRSVLVRMENTGTETWPWGDRRPLIRLAHRWLDPADGTVRHDAARTRLSADVRPGRVALQKMLIVAPDEPGHYLLDLDLVHEGVTWFGAGPRLPVTVHAAG